VNKVLGVVGLALVLALGTAAWMSRQEAARAAAAEAERQAAEKRLAELRGVQREVEAFEARKHELEMQVRLIEALRQGRRTSAGAVLQALGDGRLPAGLSVEGLSLGGDRLEVTGRARSRADAEAFGRSLLERKLLASFEVRRFEAGSFTLAAQLALVPDPEPPALP
jgi:Tfp pilus assembly protein PilN